MRVKVLRDFAGRYGAIVRAGEFVDFADDADGYNLIHVGLADPPLRLRATLDCLIGFTNVSAGDLVDVPVDDQFLSGRDVRLEPLAAVVPAEAFDRQEVAAYGEEAREGGAGALSGVGGAPIAVAPHAAIQVVRAGGRYATREEAAGLDLGGRDRFAKPAPKAPEGPTVRLYFGAFHRLPDGRTVQAGGYEDVSIADADELVAKGAKRCVKARVLRDGLVGNRWYAQGDIVEVPKSLAKDADRFEPLGNATVEKVVDVAALVAGKAVEVAAAATEKVARAAGRRPAAVEPGDAR